MIQVEGKEGSCVEEDVVGMDEEVEEVVVMASVLVVLLLVLKVVVNWSNGAVRGNKGRDGEVEEEEKERGYERGKMT